MEQEQVTDEIQALREVLEIISKSEADFDPVFESILRSASKLCEAPLSLLFLPNDSGTHLILKAHGGLARSTIKMFEQCPLEIDPEKYNSSISLLEREPIQVEDLSNTDEYRQGESFRCHMVDEEGARTILYMPLVHGDMSCGLLVLYRREIRKFDERNVSLVRAFADQAVIAIEKVRQHNELHTRLEHEMATREILEVISRSRDDERPVFSVILETAARLCNAPFACLFRANPERTHLTIPSFYGTRSRFVELINDDPLPINPEEALTARSMVEKRPLQIADFRNDPIYLAGQPHRVHAVEVEGVRTVLAVPLLIGDDAIGVIFLYRREVALFSEEDIRLVETFAAQAAIAIENVRQFKALESLNAELGDRVEEQVGEIERMARLKRFLPAAVADAVVSQGSDRMLSSHRAMLGVLFCDIRGFTAFCETAEPEETIEILQTYHEEMGKLINAHGAGVDLRMGDGIMVLFNDPLPCDDPAGDAVRLAIAMRERMADLCKQWKRLGYRLGFGVGISLGYATVGMVGFEGRFDYTASGTAINLASRLCDEAEDSEILLSPRASIAVEDDFQVESRGEVSLKGIREPLEVFKLVAAAAT